MNLSSISAFSGLSSLSALKSAASSYLQQKTATEGSASSAGSVSISQTARDLLAKELESAAGGQSVGQWLSNMLPQGLGAQLGIESSEDAGEVVDALSAKGGELKEFGALLKQHLDAVLAQNGATDPAGLQRAADDKQSRDAMLDQLKQRVTGDGRMSQLMQSLGVRMPA